MCGDMYVFLERSGVTPILVFDGQNIEAKFEENA